MGEVILVYRVLPDSPENSGKLKKNLAVLNPRRIEEDPIAFGLNAFKVTLIVPDEGGIQDKTEEQLAKIKNLESFELLMASRSM